MMRHPNRLTRLFREQDGATAVEYALIAGLVSLAVIGALTGIGSSLDTVFDHIASVIR
jgi:pilus assembly protein Flp/PilA